MTKDETIRLAALEARVEAEGLATRRSIEELKDSVDDLEERQRALIWRIAFLVGGLATAGTLVGIFLGAGRLVLSLAQAAQ